MPEEKYRKNEPASGSTLPQYLAATIATFGALVVGTTLSWTSPVLLILEDVKNPNHISKDQGSWVASLINLGACIGAIPGGLIAASLGPKRSLQLATIPFLITWIVLAYSQNVLSLLFVARVISGLSVGLVCVAGPMYVSDIAEPKVRGSLGGFFQLQITIGLLFVYVLGAFEKNYTHIALIAAVIPILPLVTSVFIPESPVYLTSKGKIDEARKSLQRLRGKNCDVENELFLIHESITEAAKNNAGLSDLIKNKTAFKALIISLALMLFQQLSGINAVLFNAKGIFEGASSTISSDTSTICIGVVQVISTYASTLLIDRAGRKILLIISSGVMSICSLILAIYFHIKNDVPNIGFLPLACLTIFIIVFSIGFGPIPWMITGELFTPEFKGTVSAMAAAFNWIIAFTVTKLFSVMVAKLGDKYTFGIFSVISCLGAIFCIFVVPETKGKTIEEVQILLGGSPQKRDVENRLPFIPIQEKPIAETN